MRTLLIDGDVLAYKCAAAVERPIKWDDGDTWTLHATESETFEAIESWLSFIMEKLEADKAVIALSDSYNFRLDIYPLYKSNRNDKRKPLTLRPAREYLIEKHGAKLKPNLEGDDVLGILATHPTLIKGEKVIVSIDKDMKTIPGLLFNDGKPDDGIVEVNPSTAAHWHMMQTLMGDATDGYPGCPQVGPVKATKILDGTDDAWAAVVAAYTKAGLTEGDALVQARVARILRHTDYDFKGGKPILWTPPPPLKTAKKERERE